MQSLIMTSPNVCMVCNREDIDCNEIGVSTLYGCIYCPNCLQSGKLKQAILAKITETNIVPCLWMNYEDTIPFFRYSQKAITIGKIAMFNDYKLIIPFEDDLCIPLSFGENYGFSRSVFVSNVIKHCDWFYNKLTNTSNVFGTDDRVVISFQELPESFKILLENCQKKAFDPLTIFLK
jgi:hypothetical protein